MSVAIGAFRQEKFLAILQILRRRLKRISFFFGAMRNGQVAEGSGYEGLGSRRLGRSAKATLNQQNRNDGSRNHNESDRQNERFPNLHAEIYPPT